MKTSYLFFLSIVLSLNIALAQDGTLDLSFGNGNGYVITDINDAYRVDKLTIFSDDKIIAVGKEGYNDYVISVGKYLPNGALDNNFGNAGIATLNLENFGDTVGIWDVKIDQNGIIYILLTTYEINNEILIISLNSNGSLNINFDQDGFLHTTFGNSEAFATSMTISSDNKIIISLFFADENLDFIGFGFAKLNSDGSLDSSFGSDGIALFNINGNFAILYSFKILDDNSIVAVGEIYDPNFEFSDMLMVKVDANGELDSQFGNNGYVIEDIDGSGVEHGLDTGWVVDIQSNNKIVVAVQFADSEFNNDNIIILRYNSNGSFDNTFDSSSINTSLFKADNARTIMVVQPDDKILVKGDDEIARLNVDGLLDTSFATDGYYNSEGLEDIGQHGVHMNDIQLTSNGKILVGGKAGTDENNFDIDGFLVFRLNNSSILNITETMIQEYIIYPNPTNDIINLGTTFSGNVEIYDVLGKKLSSIRLKQNQSVIDLTNYDSGTYFVKIISEGKIFTEKLIKK